MAFLSLNFKKSKQEKIIIDNLSIFKHCLTSKRSFLKKLAQKVVKRIRIKKFKIVGKMNDQKTSRPNFRMDYID